MLKISAVIVCLISLQFVDALPHCQLIDLPEELIQRNTINVIYTMKSSCRFCTRKAAMLPNLKAVLQAAGINANFIVAVNNQSSRLSGLAPHISVNKWQIWKTLGEQNNHFYIIDRCGRMVYEIINPWSSLQLPFLQGAIVATKSSHPCGLCPQDYAMVEKEKVKIYPPMVEEDQPLTNEEIPLGIVMRVRHGHEGDPNVYNHIVMAAHGLPGRHQHLPHETITKERSYPTISLNVQQKNKETEKISSISQAVISDISEEKKHLSADNTNVGNSIKNLVYNSQRMVNENQLLLGSSESKDSSIFNNLPSKVNANINFTEDDDTLELSTEINEEMSLDYDYSESSSEELEHLKEENQLKSNDPAEKENLKEHYKKILDWVNINN